MSLLANQIVDTSQIFHVVLRGGGFRGRRGRQKGCQGSVDQVYQNDCALVYPVCTLLNKLLEEMKPNPFEAHLMSSV